MWVKICGNTNLEDALAAVEAGADALGFIFAPSPRRISPRDAAKIIRELPTNVEKIGVFVNQKPELILQTAKTAGLTGVQLHGDDESATAHQLQRRRRGKLNIYGVHSMSMLENAGGTDAMKRSDSTFAALLLDSGTQAKRGGTGKRFDWDAAAPFVRLLSRRVNIVIAGGLDPMNVAKAIELFQPWGVDVVSGVEREPGKKDHAKVQEFVRLAKS
jgi:phosphoribosylanthranilate isomerase